MTKKVTSAPQRQNHQLLIYCPVNCKQVMANDWEQISIPGGQATWWHCPECRGWHVVVGQDNPLRANSGSVEHTTPDYDMGS
jgi:hypothetical protein